MARDGRVGAGGRGVTGDAPAVQPPATQPTQPTQPSALAAARRRAVAWTAGGGAAVAAWATLGGARVDSFAFFGMALVLLWTADALLRWRRARAAPAGAGAALGTPAGEAAAGAAAEKARAEARAAARHAAAVAARPPRFSYGLMALVAVASASQLGVIDASVEAAGLVKPAVRAGEWWRLLTATYLHGGLLHFWFNFGALRALAPLVEVYAPRTRLPLVYLAAGLAGNYLSLVLVPNGTSVGASGAILGLAGFLVALGVRQPDVLPPFLRRGLLSTLGLTAVLGIFGFALIDNSGHVGGTAMGALLGFATIPRPGRRLPPAVDRLLDALGWLAAAVLVAGALYTLVRVVPLHFGPTGLAPHSGLLTP